MSNLQHLMLVLLHPLRKLDILCSVTYRNLHICTTYTVITRSHPNTYC